MGQNYRGREVSKKQSSKENYGPTRVHTFLIRKQMRGRVAKLGNKNQSEMNCKGSRGYDGRIRDVLGGGIYTTTLIVNAHSSSWSPGSSTSPALRLTPAALPPLHVLPLAVSLASSTGWLLYSA